MRILFHSNTICFRGCSIAHYDYAWYNQEILGNESFITYDVSIPYYKDGGSEGKAIERFEEVFPVLGYHDLNHLEEICRDNRIDIVYFIKSGENDGKLVSGVKNVVHAVFQYHQPHGDVYAYISEWLSNKMTNNQSPFVPHMINMPEPEEDFRSKFRKKMSLEDKIVIGRHGGLYTFDIQWVKDELVRFAHSNPEYRFIFVNTQAFTSHPSFIFTNEIIDLQEKSNFISVCDGMIHARSGGESFGNAICEFMIQDKPVFSWTGGYDQNHTLLLDGLGSSFNNSSELIDNLLKLKRGYEFKGFKDRVQEFTPENVMKKFKEVFLS